MVKYSRDSRAAQSSVMILRELAQKRPAVVAEHDDVLLQLMLTDNILAMNIAQILLHTATVSEVKMCYIMGGISPCNRGSPFNMLKRWALDLEIGIRSVINEGDVCQT